MLLTQAPLPTEDSDRLEPLPTPRAQGGQRRLGLVVALCVVLAYFAPFLLLGQNAYINIHDNLDGEFVVNYLLVKTGTAFAWKAGTVLPNIMNGLPRAMVPSGLNFGLLLFYLFPPAWAYIVNFTLVHLVGLVGMFLLLRRHFLVEENDEFLAGAVALCFFLVPYYTTYGLTVAGQPLLAYAFLNIRRGLRRWQDYLILLLFPLWSDVALIAPFAVAALLLLLAIDAVRQRRLNGGFLGAVLLLAAAYAAVQYPLIHSILGSNHWVSQRIVWNRWTDFDLASNFSRSWTLLLTTQYHTGSFWTLPALTAILGAWLLALAGRRRAGLLDALAVSILAICLVYGFYDWLARWCAPFLPGLAAFNGGRFYFLLPLLWLLLFALCLKEFRRWRKAVPLAWCLLVLQAAGILAFNIEYRSSLRLLLGGHLYEPSFRRFFAQDLFAEIDTFIGRPKSTYRVVTVGLHPSIAQFNGFYTLDAYLTNYPLAYKRQFRSIIAPELRKDAELARYFDEWGNRCYIFSSELHLDAMCAASDHLVLHHLDLDTGRLRRMGCVYIISAVEIADGPALGLQLQREFSSPGSFWHLYLYSLGPANSKTAAARPDAQTGRRVPASWTTARLVPPARTVPESLP